MCWIGRLSPGRVTLTAALLAGLLTGPARASETTEGRQLTDLNRITGADPLKGRFKELSRSPEEAKALVSYALAQLKDHKQHLSYNGAYLLALTAQELKDLKASETFYRVCTTQAGRLESTAKLIQAYGGLIDLLYDNKRYDDAVRVCREILDMKVTRKRPRVVLLASNNRFGEADFEEIDNYNAVAYVKPAVQRIMIQAIAKEGKHDEALKLVDNLIKAQGSWEDRALKGGVLREAGKDAEAAKVYEGVLDGVRNDKELTPEERSVYEDRYRYLLSTIYVDLDKIDKAAEQLKKLVADHPDEPGYQNDLGYIWADHNIKLPEAEKLIRSALDLDRKKRAANPKFDAGENGAYLDSLGWVLFKQGKLAEAKAALEKAVQDKASQHIEIFDHLGDVCQALGQRDAALSAWRRGLDVAGNTPRERRIKTAVEKKLAQSVK
jgi:tetratricopeptide (TPR) repeat protein